MLEEQEHLHSDTSILQSPNSNNENTQKGHTLPIQKSTRSHIENALISSLDDKTKVGLILNETDLTLILNAVNLAYLAVDTQKVATRYREMADDLSTLKINIFGS